jgi:uncharacterized protein YqhQ
LKKTYYAQSLLNGIIIKGNNKETQATVGIDGKVTIKTRLNRNYKPMNYMNNMPLIRGIIVLISYLISFIKSLNDSADIISEEVDNKKISKNFDLSFMDILTVISIITSLFLTFILLIIVPSILVYLFDMIIAIPITSSILEGLLRIVMFYISLLLSSKIPKIKNMYMYHGAFHKISQCYEAGEEITMDNIKKYSSYDPKCGLSFIFSSMFISILFFSIIQVTEPGVLHTLSRCIYTLMISGICYEIMLILNNKNKQIFVGKVFQKTMVKEPTEEILLIVKKTFETNMKEGESNEKQV